MTSMEHDGRSRRIESEQHDIVTPTNSQPTVAHDRERSRYELTVDGTVNAFAEYIERGDITVFHHTVTNAAMRGRGLAAIVVRAALDDTRARGRMVDPQCWYVAQFIDAHPEYADLLASG
jgi:uncharacterized protein